MATRQGAKKKAQRCHGGSRFIRKEERYSTRMNCLLRKIVGSRANERGRKCRQSRDEKAKKCFRERLARVNSVKGELEELHWKEKKREARTARGWPAVLPTKRRSTRNKCDRTDKG
nr:PREDICTED: uncharacterized protein LOC105663490 [Megachile rotundata]